MKSLRVPLLKDLENIDLDTALESEGGRFDVNCVNWPDSYPYAPFCAGRIGRTEDSLVVDFRVSGLDLRAQNKEDNGSQWEDSCVEFFVQDPSGKCYYNFEINPLGKILAAAGPDRNNRVKRPAEEMERIVRFADPAAPTESEGGIRNWRVTVIIPFDLIGVDEEALPHSLKVNFYKCGDLTPHPHFLSWNPIGTPNPDFHRPDFFGELILD